MIDVRVTDPFRLVVLGDKTEDHAGIDSETAVPLRLSLEERAKGANDLVPTYQDDFSDVPLPHQPRTLSLESRVFARQVRRRVIFIEDDPLVFDFSRRLFHRSHSV